MVAESQTLSVRDFPAYLHFTPRPDQPERFDEQTAFYESKGDGCLFLTGGNGSGTTSCLIAKICRFVLETPPPRRDTPFWVIAETYEQIGSMWDEKFNQQGHLPSNVVDWPRIHWNNRNNNQPFRVPLKSPEGSPGKNWSLEFKSWRQGRGKMQARSLGGFGFIEQFPWGILEEVLRGCREYNFPGSKLIEFTPVDADLSQELEEMIESGYEPPTGKQPGLRYLPKNWKVYHANTMCAMEAGHVDKRWFEEFFGMVPEDMLETRMKGMFSTYEGVIYKDFNIATHCMGDEMWSRIKECYHRRGIDWGAGPENDFVCTWGAKNGLGQWFIYDEEVSNDQSKTTVDHLVDVYNKWEWPETNRMYGTTYCDPSSPDNLRIAMKLNSYVPDVENISMMRGKNAVLEGIEHMQYLLKPQIPVPVHDSMGRPVIDEATGKVKIRLEPKLFIHRFNCPKLVQQMKTYRWMRGSDPTAKAGRNPRDPARAPLKRADHACFSTDAPVNMADGTTKPISQILPGDMVLSHRGITRVLASGVTGVEKTVAIHGITGIVRCTATHPWYNYDSQLYCPLSEVQTLCKLSTITTDPAHLSKPFSGKDSTGEGIQNRNIKASDNTSEEPQETAPTENSFTSGFTRKSGNLLMGTSRKSTISTISTKTQQTTALKTCRLSAEAITADCTLTTWSERLPKLQNGTEAKKAGHGTGSTQRRSQPTCLHETLHASTVGRNTKQRPSETQLSIAPTSADTTHEKHNAKTMSRDHALSAGQCLLWTNTRRFLPVLQSVAPFDVRILPRSERTEFVYNLATEDGTFFVDGILTSNCDALRYLCFSDDFMTGSTISSAKSHSELIAQTNGEYLPSRGLRGFTTQHRNRG